MNKFDPAAYLSSLNIDVMHFGLTAITELLERLGNPQNSFKSILIAGTNGKGSTAAMLASMLQSAGYKTGLYTSPHLIDVRERIRVNRKEISKKDFGRVIMAVKKAVQQPVTYFETLTAAAFVYFQVRKVDIAVLEAGLGGRLDATNVCNPLVSVITNIGFDHMVYLGNTLAAIAREKAGIIKPCGICITGSKQKKVLEVLEDICNQNKAVFYRLGKDIIIKQRKNGLVNYHGLEGSLNDLTIPLPGRHQLDNAALALAALEIAGKKGFPAKVDAIRKGLKGTIWEGRLEIICRRPLFIIDGAHNPAGIRALCVSLKNDFARRRLILIFSSLADKNYHKMLQIIAPLAGKIILTPIQANRAEHVIKIHEFIKKIGYDAVIAENTQQAVRLAFEMAGVKDIICAAGSLYLVGEIKRAFPEMVSYDKKLGDC